jgi:hypothetical protein
MGDYLHDKWVVELLDIVVKLIITVLLDLRYVVLDLLLLFKNVIFQGWFLLVFY